MIQAPKTANATFCATVCDQLWADGLTTAFVAPGSRSTPMALALVAHPDITVHLFHDERAAAFAALGHGLATGWPALVLCTSGTAGAHFYAAVIEADASAVPLIVCTADRPPELWGRGAPQTIDQTNLYGATTRAFLEPGPPDDVDPQHWRPLARTMIAAATGATPGPVHANLSFRDPLTGTPGALPAGLEPRPMADRAEPNADDIEIMRKQLVGRRGVVIAGRHESSASEIIELAERLGWPLLADHRSRCRSPKSPNVVHHFDSLLRVPEFAQAHYPEVVLRIGEIVSSKATSQWLSACGASVLSSRPHQRHIDPEAIATLQFDERGVVAAMLRALGEDVAHDPAWLTAWTSADAIARELTERELASPTIANADSRETSEISEIEVARQVLMAVPERGALVVSSSMPVRDIEWFGPARDDIDVFSNRGANGIDGVVATAVGIALTGRPTVCLIGDVALLHDSSTLTALRQRPIDLTIVVIDNDGGGIFSFLAQHALLDADQYELLFGTPHGTDIAALGAAHGIDCELWSTDLVPRGVRMVIAHSDRRSNLAQHDRLQAAVAAALSQTQGAPNR